MNIERTHMTWSIEQSPGRCPICGSETILILPSIHWIPAEGDAGTAQQEAYNRDQEIEVPEEISGHWCEKCDMLCSLSLNT